MQQSADMPSNRRQALSTLLRYAEIEALELDDRHLAEIIRTAYESMQELTKGPRSGIVVSAKQ